MANHSKIRTRKRKKGGYFVSNLFALIYLRNQRITLKKKRNVNNLSTLLDDIYVQFIALRDHDFKLYYKVFDTILKKLHNNMKKVDPYYNKYSSTIQVSGSHFDRLRIKKPDEFDVVFTIGLPLDVKVNHYNPADSDIILKDMTAGYVELKMGKQFQRLPDRDDWQINKTLFTWKDDDYYLLRSEFSNWFKSVVNRGLDEFGKSRSVDVGGILYSIDVSEGGPAMTLIITNKTSGFKLAVDLVPGLKFPEDRWPSWSGYRSPEPPYSDEVFLVVPKPIKKENVSDVDVSRSWRLSMIYQENQILRGTYFLRHTIRFLKKLRDALEMHHISSYCIKNLFLSEAVKQNDLFWQQAPSKLFVMMVKKFKKALEAKNIPYFWNPNQNLIENVEDCVLVGYAARLEKLVQVLKNPAEYEKVAKFLLTQTELAQYM